MLIIHQEGKTTALNTEEMLMVDGKLKLPPPSNTPSGNTVVKNIR